MPTTPKSSNPQETVAEPVAIVEKRQIRQQNETFDVEVTYNEWGQAVLTEAVYKEVPLPNSKKTTKVLVAAKGSVVQG